MVYKSITNHQITLLRIKISLHLNSDYYRQEKNEDGMTNTKRPKDYRSHLLQVAYVRFV